MNIEEILKAIETFLAVADEKECEKNRFYNELVGNLTFAKFDAEVLLGKRTPM